MMKVYLRKSLILIILLSMCLLATGSKNLLSQNNEKEVSEIAVKEILTYALLMAYNTRHVNHEFSLQATKYIVQTYHQLEERSHYFSAARLAKIVMKDILLSKQEQILQKEGLYQLSKTALEFARLRHKEDAKGYLQEVEDQLANESNSELVKACWPLVIESYLTMEEFEKGLALLEEKIAGVDESFSFYLVDNLINKHLFDQAFDVANLLSFNKQLQIEVLVNIAVGYGKSQVSLSERDRKILQSIATTALKS